MGDLGTTLIALRPASKQDIPLVLDWATDPKVTRWMALGRLPGAHLDILLPGDMSANAVFIVTAEKPAGIAGLYAIDWISRKAELRIMLAAEYHGHGIGTKVVRELVDYGFTSLALERIWLGTAADNEPACRAFRAAGFVEEGCLKRDLFRDSHWYDTVRMAILRPQWREFGTGPPGPFP